MGQSVTLADGSVVQPDDVLGQPQRGPKLVLIGDAATTDGLESVANRADALVCESTYLWEDRETARKYGHLTAREAAELARQAEVSALLLTHISRRYSKREVYEEASEVFEPTIVADDFDKFAVYRDEVRQIQEA
jgi:ribonuclease Z